VLKQIKIAGLLILGLAALLALAVFGQRWRAQKALRMWMVETRSRGEKLEIEALIPPAPAGSRPLDPALRQFSVPLPDIFYRVPNPMTFVTPSNAAISWKLTAWEKRTGGTNDWTSIETLLAGKRENLKAFEAELEISTHYSAGIDYHAELAQANFNAVQGLDGVSRLLSLETLMALREGRPEDACAALRALTLLVEKQDSIRIPHFQHVRFSSATLAWGTLWEALQTNSFPVGQLTDLQAIWEKIHFHENAMATLEMDRNQTIAQFEVLRNSPGHFTALVQQAVRRYSNDDRFFNYRPILVNTVVPPLWKAVWTFEDELFALRLRQHVIDEGRIRWRRITGTNSGIEVSSVPSDSWNPNDYHRDTLKFLFSAGNYYSGEWLLERAREAEAQRALAIAALALQRFQKNTGRWPDTLNELAPAYFDAVPKDPYDGHPLRYKKGNDETFRLYSVGEDGVDGEGTKLSGNGRKLLDLVWPEAAKIPFLPQKK
jgi:hypothetical protein